MSEKKLFCPFNQQECSAECALYVSPEEFNEVVLNKLASVGVLNRNKGYCSLKNISMNMNRQTFEQLLNIYR